MLPKAPPFWKMLKIIATYFNVGRGKGPIALIIGCVVLSKVLITMAPLVFREAVHRLEAQSIPGAVFCVVSYGLLRILSSWFFELKDCFFLPIEQQAVKRLSVDIFHRMQYSPLSFHVDRKTGELLRIMEQGTKAIEDIGKYFVFYMVPLFLEMGLVCVFLWLMYPPFFGFSLLGTFGAYGLFTLIVAHMRLKWLKEMTALDHKASTKSLDTLMNYAVVKYFHQEEEETRRYQDFLKQYQRAGMKMRYSLMVLNMGQALILSVGLVLILVNSLYAAAAGTMRIGDFALVNLYVLQFLLPLHGLGFIYRELVQAWLYLKKMLSLREVPAEEDQGQSQPLQWKGGSIEFRDVYFSYNPDAPVLRGCSFTVPAGKTFALVGSSGAGKTTISSLMARFFDAQKGTVFIDGQDIRMVSRRSLRQALGIVPQETILFDNTIAYNLRYGSPDATDEDVHEAARKARIHDFIMRLPQGYETHVGERGLKLSGGEKQRLSIARVLVRNPEIFIFDEATAYLDAITEKEIQESISEITAGKTTLIIAHRLSVVQNADCILVLHGGELVEQGTHQELLQRNGLYTALWLKQSYTGGAAGVSA